NGQKFLRQSARERTEKILAFRLHESLMVEHIANGSVLNQYGPIGDVSTMRALMQPERQNLFGTLPSALSH
ncbi:MAG TPA: hypothetical protein VEK06_05110, partial [Myxococcota bacterium]|nr:hypothetical protein [Myxococcota bacterium]